MQSIKSLLVASEAAFITSNQLTAQAAKFEVQYLLQTLLNVNRAWLISHENEVLEAPVIADFKKLTQRRLAGEPIAYIVGAREFFGLYLKVTPDTLIPRPDTETLVEAALAKTAQDKALEILDLGTGSGAVALAIAKNRPNAEVFAVDFSERALKVAQENAENLAIQNVHFFQSDWFNALEDQRFDVIVSNPPYIEDNDAHLTQGDLRFEPLTALVSGKDGLDDIRKIILNSLVFLKPQGWLMLEHGYKQALAVQDLMAAEGLVEVATQKDLGGNDRVTVGKNPLIVSQHWG